MPIKTMLRHLAVMVADHIFDGPKICLTFRSTRHCTRVLEASLADVATAIDRVGTSRKKKFDDIKQGSAMRLISLYGKAEGHTKASCCLNLAEDSDLPLAFTYAQIIFKVYDLNCNGKVTFNEMLDVLRDLLDLIF
ncbi:hypothetical protein IFM89_037336 [Coptis chinensis]|uniref:EF-hand domain-containing protein n=1 Tax=Coptis chinensis TaxID=261450 RepID=A0A835HHP4_9MAGN|nr:hypothetical protein IFM89_037336 [Coptis chinensis]